MTQHEIKAQTALELWEHHKTLCARCAIDTNMTRLLGRMCYEGTQLYITLLAALTDSERKEAAAAAKKNKKRRRPQPPSHKRQ